MERDDPGSASLTPFPASWFALPALAIEPPRRTAILHCCVDGPIDEEALLLAESYGIKHRTITRFCGNGKHLGTEFYGPEEAMRWVFDLDPKREISRNEFAYMEAVNSGQTAFMHIGPPPFERRFMRFTSGPEHGLGLGDE